MAGDQRFNLAELSRLCTARGPAPHPWVTAGVLCAASAGAAVATVGMLSLGWLLALGVVSAVSGAVAFRAERRHRRYELWADYRGATVRLFVSSDERQYNQVCRALIRAREHSHLGQAREVQG